MDVLVLFLGVGILPLAIGWLFSPPIVYNQWGRDVTKDHENVP